MWIDVTMQIDVGRPTLTSKMYSVDTSANTGRWLDVGPTLGHRLRRWPSIGQTSRQRLVFAGRYIPQIHIS